MFGIDGSELLIVAVLALLFIGPKELPAVMVRLGRMIGKVRGYARHFTSGIEEAMRAAELEEMDRQWREQNQKILAQYPADAHYPEPVMTPGAAIVPPPPPPPVEMGVEDEPGLPFEAPAAPDEDPTPVDQRPLP